jgi:hypothetical protein
VGDNDLDATPLYFAIIIYFVHISINEGIRFRYNH